MKKSKLMLFSIISMILLSGCGRIDNALNNMKDLKSFTITVEQTENDNVSRFVYDVDVINKTVRETGNYNLSAGAKEYVSYSQYIDGKFVSYTSSIFGEGWIYDEFYTDSVSDDSIFGVLYASSCNYDDIDVVLSLEPSVFKKVKSEKKGIYKYTIDLEELNDIVDFNYYIYTDGKYVTKIEMEYGSVSEIISFSNFNNASVIIPDSVKENAKEVENIDFSDIDFSQLNDIDILGIDNDFILEQYEQAKDFFNQDVLNSDSDDFEKKIQEVQDYMYFDEYQRQIQAIQERTRELLNH